MTFKEWLSVNEVGIMGGIKAGWSGLKSAIGMDTSEIMQKMDAIRQKLAMNISPEEREALTSQYKKYLQQGYGDEADQLNMPIGHSSPEELDAYRNRDDVKNVLTRPIG